MRQLALTLGLLLFAVACVPEVTTRDNDRPTNLPTDRPTQLPDDDTDDNMPDGDVADDDIANDLPDAPTTRTEYADWMNVGGTDPEHPSGVASHIRKKGIRDALVERAELTREVLGRDAKLGVWMPFGVRRDLYSGKLRFAYESHPDLGSNWSEEFVAGVRLARQKHGIEVVPYLGKISNCTPRQFDQMLSLLRRAGIKTVIVDNLSDTGDSEAPELVARLRALGLRVGSEFPERRNDKLADFGFAADQSPLPSGSLRGASFAERNGAIPNGQPLAILLQGRWPQGMAARIRHWERTSDRLTLYANLNESGTRAVVERAMRTGG